MQILRFLSKIKTLLLKKQLLSQVGDCHFNLKTLFYRTYLVAADT